MRLDRARPFVVIALCLAAASMTAGCDPLARVMSQGQVVADATPWPLSPPGVAIVQDPSLNMTLPPGWETVDMSEYRDRLVSFLESAEPGAKAAYREHLDHVDSGAVRIAAAGPTGYGPWTGSLVIEVDSGDASLEAAASRIEEWIAGGATLATKDRREVSLGIGDAIRLEMSTELPPDAPDGSIPARLVHYVFMLDDGRTLWISSTGPAAADGFADLIDAAVATLAGP